MSREFWWSSGPHPTFQIGRLQQLFLTWPPESVPSVPRAFCKKIQYFSVEIFCWVCRWKGSVPIYSTTRAEQAFEPHHYSDSFLLNMKWFCGQPAVSRSQLNREPATPLLISIDKKFASPLCPVSLRRRRKQGYHISRECKELQRECLNSIWLLNCDKAFNRRRPTNAIQKAKTETETMPVSVKPSIIE